MRSFMRTVVLPLLTLTAVCAAQTGLAASDETEKVRDRLLALWKAQATEVVTAHFKTDT
jgi:hypothetical protein